MIINIKYTSKKNDPKQFPPKAISNQTNPPTQHPNQNNIIPSQLTLKIKTINDPQLSTINIISCKFECYFRI